MAILKTQNLKNKTIIFILIIGNFLIIKADIQNVNRICPCSEQQQCLDDTIPRCLPPANKRVIREVPLGSDEDSPGGGTTDNNEQNNNNNFDGEGAKEEPDTMMIYDDDTPVAEENGGEERKETTTKLTTTISSSTTIKSSTTTKQTETTKIKENITKNLINEKIKNDKSIKIIEEIKKNSDKNETPRLVGMNNNNNSEKIKETFTNEENNKSKSHKRNCNSELLRRIILEVFNDNNVGSRPSIAKRKIQSKVTEELGGRIDVICSRKAFSYVVNSEVFCEVEKAEIVCLAYKQQG